MNIIEDKIRLGINDLVNNTEQMLKDKIDDLIGIISSLEPLKKKKITKPSRSSFDFMTKKYYDSIGEYKSLLLKRNPELDEIFDNIDKSESNSRLICVYGYNKCDGVPYLRRNDGTLELVGQFCFISPVVYIDGKREFTTDYLINMGENQVPVRLNRIDYGLLYERKGYTVLLSDVSDSESMLKMHGLLYGDKVRVSLRTGVLYAKLFREKEGRFEDNASPISKICLLTSKEMGEEIVRANMIKVLSYVTGTAGTPALFSGVGYDIPMNFWMLTQDKALVADFFLTVMLLLDTKDLSESDLIVIYDKLEINNWNKWPITSSPEYYMIGGLLECDVYDSQTLHFLKYKSIKEDKDDDYWEEGHEVLFLDVGELSLSMINEAAVLGSKSKSDVKDWYQIYKDYDKYKLAYEAQMILGFNILQIIISDNESEIAKAISESEDIVMVVTNKKLSFEGIEVVTEDALKEILLKRSPKLNAKLVENDLEI